MCYVLVFNKKAIAFVLYAAVARLYVLLLVFGLLSADMPLLLEIFLYIFLDYNLEMC